MDQVLLIIMNIGMQCFIAIISHRENCLGYAWAYVARYLSNLNQDYMCSPVIDFVVCSVQSILLFLLALDSVGHSLDTTQCQGLGGLT